MAQRAHHRAQLLPVDEAVVILVKHLGGNSKFNRLKNITKVQLEKEIQGDQSPLCLYSVAINFGTSLDLVTLYV